MFAKLKISIEEVREFINAFDWRAVSKKDIDSYFDSEKDASKDILDSALLKNNIWDGDGVREMNFPRQIGTRHIFISHSHDDIEEVKRFAYFLEQELGVKCFVDSMVWKNMNDLICELDDEYILHSSPNQYSYDKHNYITSHVHTMLTTALLEMINDCECFLFIGSENSTLKLRYFKNHSDATLSPWIYEENTFVKFVKPVIPEWILRRRKLNCFSGGIGRIDEDRRVNIAYKLDMSSFHTISAELLSELVDEDVEGNDFLYELYKNSGVLRQLKPLFD